MEAGRAADALVFAPGFVRGGPASDQSRELRRPVRYACSRRPDGRGRPDCWLHHQANFSLTRDAAPPGRGRRTSTSSCFRRSIRISRPRSPGRRVRVGAGRPARGPGFMEFIASPEWGEVWARDADADSSSPNRRFDMRGLRRRERSGGRRPVAPLELAARRRCIRRVQVRRLGPDARRDRRLRPTARARQFWQGMLDWVDGARTLDQVFADIDAEWAALRTNSARPAARRLTSAGRHGPRQRRPSGGSGWVSYMRTITTTPGQRR